MKPSVAVMMSSFNGEAFIMEQLESILDQTDVDVQLYVRDDGSSDATLDILDSYASHSNVHVAQGTHKGFASSFMHLLWSLPDTYDYYAFSDQDDIWPQDKLSTAVDVLKRTSASLYASNLACIDVDKRPLGNRFDALMPCSDALAYIVKSRYHGCTQVFDRGLFRTLCTRRPQEDSLKRMPHDKWVSVSAGIVGTVVYDPIPHIGYRRHKDNYTVFDKSAACVWRRRLRKLVHPDELGLRSTLAREALACYGDCLSASEVQQLEPLANAHRLKDKVTIMQRKDAYIGQDEPRAWFVAKTLAGLI